MNKICLVLASVLASSFVGCASADPNGGSSTAASQDSNLAASDANTELNKRSDFTDRYGFTDKSCGYSMHVEKTSSKTGKFTLGGIPCDDVAQGGPPERKNWQGTYEITNAWYDVLELWSPTLTVKTTPSANGDDSQSWAYRIEKVKITDPSPKTGYVLVREGDSPYTLKSDFDFRND
jgi:hypothetical protein